MNPFDEMEKTMDDFYNYTPKTGEQLQASYVDDIIEWADAIAGEWDGDEAGSQEDRAHCADDIIEKLNQVKELIAEMGEL